MSITTDRNAQDARIESNELRLAIADAEFLTVFLSLNAEERASRWRGLDYGSKFRLCARQIEAKGYDWDEESVTHFIAKYDEKYASDLPVPAAAEILAVAKEQRADAVRQNDDATVRQLDRVIVGVTCGAAIHWVLGDLHVSSVNNPGVTYVLSCGRCPCKATKPCWHLKLWDILLDMADTAADDADLEAEADEMEVDQNWAPVITDERTAITAHGQRLALARSRYDWAA